jgi:hypothetical protein
MQYRFKIIHEEEDPIYTDWRDDVLYPAANSPRLPHLKELHEQYPLASIGTEFQGLSEAKPFAWMGCPFTDKEKSNQFAETMEGAGYRVRRRDGICIGVGGPQEQFEDMKKLAHQALGAMVNGK